MSDGQQVGAHSETTGYEPGQLLPPVSRFSDAVRGAAAFVVLLAHVEQIFTSPYVGNDSWLAVAGRVLAAYAVMTFFFLSGFMICTSVVRNVRRNGVFDPAYYFDRRFWRIYPPLVFAVVLTALVWAAIVGLGLVGSETFRMADDVYVVREQASFEWAHATNTILMLHNIVPQMYEHPSLNGALWSISYEFWFYALFGLIVAAWFGWHRAASAGLVVAAVTYLIWIGHPRFGLFSAIWLAGVLAGGAHHFMPLYVSSAARRFWILLGVAVVWASGTLVLITSGRTLDLRYPYSSQDLTFGVTVTIGLVFVVTTEVLRRGGRFRLLTRGPFVRLAPSSYTLYAIHFPLLMLGFSALRTAMPTRPSVEVSTLAGCVFAALALLISHHAAQVVENRARMKALVQGRFARSRA